MEPSSAAHKVTILTHSGEAIRECSATYCTEKSSVRSATSIVAIAVVRAKNTATAANRAEVCKRASRRRAPKIPTTTAYNRQTEAEIHAGGAELAEVKHDPP